MHILLLNLVTGWAFLMDKVLSNQTMNQPLATLSYKMDLFQLKAGMVNAINRSVTLL